MLRPLCTWEKPWYPLKCRLDEPQCRYGRFGYFGLKHGGITSLVIVFDRFNMRKVYITAGLFRTKFHCVVWLLNLLKLHLPLRRRKTSGVLARSCCFIRMRCSETWDTEVVDDEWKLYCCNSVNAGSHFNYEGTCVGLCLCFSLLVANLQTLLTISPTHRLLCVQVPQPYVRRKTKFRALHLVPTERFYILLSRSLCCVPGLLRVMYFCNLVT